MNKLINISRLLFVFLILFISLTGSAFVSNHQSTLVIANRQLTLEKESHELVKKQLGDLQTAKNQQYQLLRDKGVSRNILKHAQLDFIAARAAVEGANIALTDATEAIEETDNSIRNLEKNLQSLILLNNSIPERKDKIISIEANIEFLKRLQQIQTDRVTTLNKIKAITQQRLMLENDWQQRLQVLYSLQQQDHQRNYLSELLTNLQQQQQDWLLKLSNLNQELQLLMRQDQVSDANIKKLHLRILEAEENVALIRLKSYLVHVQNRIDTLQEMNKTEKSSTQLNELVELTSNALSQLNATKEFVNGKINFLNLKKNELTADLQKQILSLQDTYGYSQMLANIINNYNHEIAHIDKIVERVSYHQREFKVQLQHHLSERQKFPNDFSGWMTLGQRMLQIPYLLVNALQSFTQQVLFELNNLDQWLFNAVLALPFVLFAAWYYLRRYLLNIEINIREDKQRFSTNVVYMIIELTRRNIGSMLIFIVLLFTILSLNFSTPVFLYLLLVSVAFKLLFSVTKLLLLENTNNISGNDVKLYYRIRWSLVLGFALSTMTVIAHNLPVVYEAKIVANRLFMVFILLIASQLFKARTIIPDLLESIIHIPRRYFYRALQLLSWLMPFALFINAIIGLLGYVELAWTMAKLQGIFILVLVGYLVVRGLLIDAMESLSEVFIRHVNQGWLWTEAILKPLDRIFRIILFIISSVFLAHLFHLDNNEQFLKSLNQILHGKLFSFGGNVINVLILCEFLIIVSLIKWLAHWSREFSYRWLYVNSKDVGVRNSLSVFTQYASVIVSVLIGLKWLGIDLRGFTVVAAAFAAGIGFGMRDLIVNFFSGILLLIERPFRTGDIITLGSYEGEVILTGMRSMTIRTWDHMEVIVPNSDMFTKAFMNWTHHDNIVRTVITLKIHREDDPHKVQYLILNLLRNHRSVTNDPPPEVIMNELSDSLIEMQVRYYVLLTNQRTRAGVRSEVLFAIWDCFKEHNIRAPHPQYDLVVRNNRDKENNIRFSHLADVVE